MSAPEKVFVPSFPYEAGEARGVLSPFEPGSQVLPVGYQIQPRFRPLPVEIAFEKDVAVKLRDGVTIYVDVFRPVDQEQVPALVAWSPYGKSQGTTASVTGIYKMIGLDEATLSGLAKFEGPDPAYWCANGYAVCNPDPRGIANSEGDSAMFGTQEGQDCYDVIEWLAEQEWCSGKVAMSGTSYLAISQWYTAAEQPPHLAAISPTEGFSDVYRDLVMHGGVPDVAFAERLRHNYAGNGQREDVAEEAQRYPLMNELWQDKAAKFEQITVPAYVVASYSNTLHAAGTFRGWRRIASQDKWLRVHNGQEWPDYYDHDNTEDLRRFYDHFLKGADNGWESTPRVRYSLLDLQGGDRVNLPAASFPPAEVTNTKYYLDGLRRTLDVQAPIGSVDTAYDPNAYPGQASFSVRFAEETVLVGYPKAHLWVEAKDADDLDLFLLVQKLDAYGTPLQQFTVPNQSAMLHDLTEHNASVLRYWGSPGRLRASARRLDETRSTDTVPAHAFDRVEKLQPGEVAEIDVDLLPVGLVFHPGEQLRLVISGTNQLGSLMPFVGTCTPQNSGQHVIHTGGDTPSYLQLPVHAGKP